MIYDYFIKIDRGIFLILNSLATWPGLASFLRLIANDFLIPVLFALALFYLWIVPGVNNKKIVFLAICSNGLVNLVIKIIDLAFFRPRPFLVIPTNLLYYRPTVSSFPSVPAAVVFSIASAIYIYNKKFGTYAIFVAAVYSVDRVIVGVHYPSDILIGALMGFVASYVIGKNVYFDYLYKLSYKLLTVFKIDEFDPLKN